MTAKNVTLWIFGSLVLMAVGAFGPWAKVFGTSVYAYDRDGAIILVLGAGALIAAIFMVSSAKRPRPVWTYIVCIVVGALCTLTGRSSTGPTSARSASSRR